MSIAYRIFLAATLAAGLMVSGGAQAAVQRFSIALTDMTFQLGSNLSAEAAAFGTQPAIELRNNGSYSETLTGDYAVSDTLPPSDQSVFWQTSTENLAQRQSVFHRRCDRWAGKPGRHLERHP
jgi:hypothetical protein